VNARGIAVAAATLAAVILVGIEIQSWPHSAGFNSSIQSVSRCVVRVVTVNPADAVAGLREGDGILLSRMTTPARTAIAWNNTPTQTGHAGDAIQLAVQRGNSSFFIPYKLRHTDTPLKFAAQLGFKFFLLAIGVFVLWRGRDRAATVLGIWCLGVGVGLPDAWWGGLPLDGRIFGGALTAALWTYSPLMLYLVVESIATGVSRRAIVVARTAMLLTVAPALILNTVNATAQAQTGCAVVNLAPWAANSAFSAAQLVIIAFFAFSYVRTTGIARQRIRWVFWAFMISRFGVLLNLFNRLLPHPIHLSGAEWLTVMIFPLGCAYAILRHRIIDVNFVLNRTLIYTILTSFAVGIFVLLEHILNSVAVSREGSLAVELAVALALGLSFNVVLKRMEQFLDRTLFRGKYEAAVALQQLAEDAAYMENPETLLESATREIPRVMGARGAAIYERVDGRYALAAATGLGKLPAEVGVDDAAFVRLRKHLSQIDLSDVNSALGSDAIAFALSVRGQLTGAFICGPRINGETFAPDEIALLRNVTHEIGVELHAIRSREMAEILNALTSGMMDLPAARLRLARKEE
jgi:hypothetical protein